MVRPPGQGTGIEDTANEWLRGRAFDQIAKINPHLTPPTPTESPRDPTDPRRTSISIRGSGREPSSVGGQHHQTGSAIKPSGICTTASLILGQR